MPATPVIPAGAPRIVPFTERALAGRFEGRTILVTGAGSGIGLATTLRLAREGARVVAADISEANLNELVQRHPGLPIVPVLCDVTDQQQVDAVIAACEGRLDGLVNNAGVMDGFQPVGEVSDDVLDRILGINVWGTVRMTRAALPLLLDGGGSVVNIASMAALGGGFGGVAYTASKHAVIGVTKNTAVMYAADGVRCNAVAPGAVITPIESKVRSELGGRRLGPIAAATMPSLARPEAVAATITYLLSDDAATTTGAVVTSDGGWAAL